MISFAESINDDHQEVIKVLKGRLGIDAPEGNKTLGDYLLSGGVEGRHFVATCDAGAIPGETYRVTGFYAPDVGGALINVVFDGQEDDGNQYCMGLERHLSDKEALPDEIKRAAAD